MAQTLDPVTLHQPHGAGVEIGPHGLVAVALCRLGKPLGDLIQGHGSADAVGCASAIELAAKMAETDFPRLVAAQLAKLDAGGETRADERRGESGE